MSRKRKRILISEMAGRWSASIAYVPFPQFADNRAEALRKLAEELRAMAAEAEEMAKQGEEGKA